MFRPLPHCRPLLPAALLLLPLAARAQTPPAAADFALHSGDRVVFYGDSITDQRLYTTFAETFVVTRFPRLNVRFVHSGWGGDRVSGGGGGPIDKRLERDVLAYKPTVMTIMLGMNDAGYRAFDEGVFSAYAAGYQHIVDKVKTALPGVRLTFVQPSPFDDVTRAPKFDGGYNAVLVRYGDYLRTLALKERARTADLNAPVVADLQKANALDAPAAQKLVPDRVHPAPGGHLLMAKALLKAWNAPALVTAVTVDAAASRVTRASNTKASAVTRTANGALTWTQTDDALPFPLDTREPTIALAVRASDIEQTLDQQPLVVTGLDAQTRYALKIDGEEAGAFTAEQFAGGVNLAVLPTPMVRQALAVHNMTLAHNNLHFTRWRQIQVPNEGSLTPYLQQAMRYLDAAEEDLVREQRALAQPKPRRYELTPQR